MTRRWATWANNIMGFIALTVTTESFQFAMAS